MLALAGVRTLNSSFDGHQEGDTTASHTWTNLDAVFLRNESIDDPRSGRGPAVGLVFGQMLKARGVTVVNDPMSLVRATSKLYLEEFPEKIRQRIAGDARPGSDRAVRRRGRTLRRQPLYGAKGRNVFMIEDQEETNLAQMTEAVLQDGYAIVQEFVDGGENGDARIFLLEGQILERDGKPAAFRRVPTGNDPLRQHQQRGRSVPLEIGDVELGIIDAMSDKLVADGMFFVGIDVIGGKVVEINAESPAGCRASRGSTTSTSARPSSKPWSAVDVEHDPADCAGMFLSVWCPQRLAAASIKGRRSSRS